MLLSIIIVNYNVKELLKDCLISVYEYSRDIDCEVFVVDNNSSDGSIEMLEYDFPNVRLIANTENVGFSTANNQAIQKAQGTYTLILNPDTLVYQDTFGNCIDFMQANADCGAIGVKMVNAEGKFLAESKRSFPNPMASLFKLIGLAQLFKKSDLFKSYYLDKLDKDEIHQVETLAGAFMWVRTSILQKVKGFDESFLCMEKT
jgi:GT2 family glycosyltransferase